MTGKVNFDHLEMGGLSEEDQALLSGETGDQVDMDQMAMGGLPADEFARLTGSDEQVDVDLLALGGVGAEEMGIVQARMQMLDRQDEVFARDRNQCIKCKLQWPSEKLTMVRVVKRPGGEWVPSDHVTACNKCIQEIVDRKALAARG